ncbi:surface-adhesin E family protein [Leeia oryzae]|uniref:surface-adhesin E family protein n=1 Tax=Leeia oryzae TaxID=356662 RepID=UPI003571500B
MTAERFRLDRRFLIGVLSFWMLSSSICAAASWLSVGNLADGNTHSYDATKLNFEPDEVTYWRRIVFTTPVEIAKGRVVLGLYRERINCKSHTLLLLDWLLYDAQNKLLERASQTDTDAKAIVPDTIGDAFASKLCPLVPVMPVPVPVDNAVASAPAAKSNKPLVPATPAKPAQPVAPTVPASTAATTTPSSNPDDQMIVIPGNGEPQKQ